MKRTFRTGVALLAVAAVVASAPLPATADVVTVTSVVTVGSARVLSGQPGVSIATTIDLKQENNTPSGDANGCNAGSGESVTVSLSVPSGVQVNPASVVFTGCGTRNVSFMAAAPGDYAVVTRTTGGKRNSLFVEDSFVVRVAANNNAPVVTIGGVVAGATYEKGEVPAAVCNVADDKDGSSTFPATVTAPAGPLASYGLGSATASCSTTDSGGLTGTASVTFAVADRAAPSLVVPGDLRVEAAGPQGAVASFAASATDAVDASPTVACEAGALVSGSVFPLGSTSVTCTASDAAGNRSQDEFTVTVGDLTPPTVAVPGTTFAEATGPTGAVVGFTATATDLVDGTLVPTCVPATGSLFALGTALVGCSAADSAGNTGTAGFSVTVRDTTRPLLVLPADQVVEATSGKGALADVTASATDTVDDDVPVSCEAAAGTIFGLGATTVSCQASDDSGNTALGSFTVTVVDTTAPDLVLPVLEPVEATGPNGADVPFSVTASDLVDGTVVPDCTPVLSSYPLGSTLVTCTVEDEAGNDVEGSFTVEVVDTTDPVLSGVPDDRTVEATGPGGALVGFDLPTAIDLVSGATVVTCTSEDGLSSGDTFPLGTTSVLCSTADGAGNGAEATFSVTVQDTTAPVVEAVASFSVEATGPDGADVEYTTPGAVDLVDGDVPVTCAPAPGSRLPLGATVVTCTATDATDNAASETFVVSVVDTTAPALTLPEDRTVEATGPAGAPVTYPAATALDVVDGQTVTSCTPPSGSTFALGSTLVTCSSTDAADNTAVGGFGVTVVDTTEPTLDLPGADVVVEATGPSGAAVTFAAAATDVVDGVVPVRCTVGGEQVTSGAVLPLGTSTVTCSATDEAGNTGSGSFTVVVRDTTAPVVTVPASATAEATGPSGAVLTFPATAADLVDGVTATSCTPVSGSTFPIGETVVTCVSTDAAGNTGRGTVTVTVRDTTAPTLVLPASVQATASSAAGGTAAWLASATDVVDGAVAVVCSAASGSTFAPGDTVVRCTATDRAGNSATGTVVVQVRFVASGFLRPVDSGAVVNVIKAGSTVPLKWTVSDGAGGSISSLAVVRTAGSGTVACATGAQLDSLEEYATGGTALRYDAVSAQFVYNWQSPKRAGSCYDVKVVLTDGSVRTARFQLR